MVGIKLYFVQRGRSSPSSSGFDVVDAMFAVAVDGRLDVNVALNRTSYQVSTWSSVWPPYTFPASYANDGNHGTDLHLSPCSHTEYAVNPWWAVDLLVSLVVAGVKFTSRNEAGT